MAADDHHVYFTFSENFVLNNGGDDVVVTNDDVQIGTSLVQYHKIPLSEKARYFTMTVRSLSEGTFIMCGLNPKCYLGKPQWISNNNVRYVSDTGGVFNGGPGLHSDHPYGKGDTVMIYVEQIFPEKCVVNFFKNGAFVYRQWVMCPPDQLYATIGVSRGPSELTMEWPQMTGEEIPQKQELMSKWHGFKHINRDDDEKTLELTSYDDKERLAFSIQAPRPLDRECSYFEMEIMTRVDEECGQGLGLSAAWTEKFRMPGWDSETIGYHADDGGVYHDSGETRDCMDEKWKCSVGDRMGCGIIFPTTYPASDLMQSILVVVYFTKNGDVIYRRCRKQPIGGFYPKVGFTTKGDKVRITFPTPVLPPDDTASFIAASADLYEDFRFMEILEFRNFEQTGGSRIFLREEEKKISTAQFLREALNDNTGYFQIRILETGESADVQIGVATSDFPVCGRSLGSNASSAGYTNSTGAIAFNSEKIECKKWSKDDLVGCYIEYFTPICAILAFTCNGKLIGRGKVLTAESDNIYATVSVKNGPVEIEVDWPGRVSGKPAQDMADFTSWIHSENVSCDENIFTLWKRDYDSDDPAQWVISPRPLMSGERQFIQYRVWRKTENTQISFGLVSATSKLGSLFGVERGTICYYPFMPEVFSCNITTKHEDKPADDFDVFGCGIIRKEGKNLRKQQPVIVYFTKNSAIFHHEVFQQQVGGIYPAVFLDHEGDAVEVDFNADAPDISETMVHSWWFDKDSARPSQSETFSADLMSDVMQYMPNIYEKDEAQIQGEAFSSSDRKAVYISHAYIDIHRLDRLVSGLPDRQFSIDLSSWNPSSNAKKTKIQSCDVVIVILSENYSNDDDASEEFTIIMNNQKAVLPIVVDGITYPPGGQLKNVSDYFNNIENERLDFSRDNIDVDEVERKLRHLIDAVAKVEKPTATVSQQEEHTPSTHAQETARSVNHIEPEVNTPRTTRVSQSRTCVIL